MTIGEVLKEILNAPDDHTVVFAFGGIYPTRVDSYRGDYSEAALGFSSGDYGNERMTVANFRRELQNSIDGREYHGWKGGLYRYNKSTPLHVDNYGNCSNTEIERIEVNDYDIIIHTRHEV